MLSDFLRGRTLLAALLLSLPALEARAASPSDDAATAARIVALQNEAAQEDASANTARWVAAGFSVGMMTESLALTLVAVSSPVGAIVSAGIVLGSLGTAVVEGVRATVLSDRRDANLGEADSLRDELIARLGSEAAADRLIDQASGANASRNANTKAPSVSTSATTAAAGPNTGFHH